MSSKRKSWLVLLAVTALVLVTMLGGIITASAGGNKADEGNEPENGQAVSEAAEATGPESGSLESQPPGDEKTGGEEGTGDEGTAEPGNQGDIPNQGAVPGEDVAGDLCCPPPTPKGKIKVIKFLDTNENGERDCGEPGIQGVTIYLDGSNPQVTDDTGVVEYTNLPGGTYVVSEEVPEGYRATTPTSYTVELECGYSNGQDGPMCAIPCEKTVEFGNVPLEPGSISGTKWLDLDGNGSHDADEPPLAGVTIKLFKDGRLVDQTLTDDDGTYSFEGLLPGTYTVRETVPEGMENTSPESVEVTLEEGGDVTGVDFLNKEKPTYFWWNNGTVEVLVFVDCNHNMEYDEGEDILVDGVPVELYHVIDGSWTPADGYDGSYQKETGPGAAFSMPPYPGGWAGWAHLPMAYGIQLWTEYAVQITPPEGYVATNGTVSDVFFHFPFCCWNKVEFPLERLGSITGTKYEDADCSGTISEGDLPVEGITIELWQDGEKVAETQTGENGAYSFDGLLPGVYDVVEVLPEGWYPVSPEDGSHEGVQVACGDVAEGVDFLNARYSSITGIKYLDLNENGIKDEGEEGLDGVTILLNGGEQSAVTADGGWFSFENLLPGVYTVSVDETSLPGYYPTSPSAIEVKIICGQEVMVYFGNAPYGSISGTKWLDADADGYWDADETQVIEGITIELYEGDSAAGEPLATTVTGEDGSYAFTDLPAGTYTVVEKAGGDMFSCTPDEVVVNLSAGEGAVVDFGNCPYSRVEGLKFLDLDGDGAHDPGEPGLEGVTVTLYGTDGTGALAVTTTGEDGSFIFPNLLPGDYHVEETVPSGYYATRPVGVDVAVGPGESVSVIFANAPYASISGHKWQDNNGDGVHDEGEPPVEDVTITLYGKTLGGTTVQMTTATGEDGSYSFLLLEAGDYTVSEVVPENMTATSDVSVDVELLPGMQAEDIDFLNAVTEVGGEVVTPPVTPSGGQLPYTGSDLLTIFLVAGILSILGLGLLLEGLRRMRRSA